MQVDDVIQLWPQAWEKSKLSQARLSQGSRRVLSEPLGKSITHCPNCDSCCRNLIAGPSAEDHPDEFGHCFCSLGSPLRSLSPAPNANLCSSLHLCVAYYSAESHSSSFAGVSVLSAFALITLYFRRYICSAFNLL